MESDLAQRMLRLWMSLLSIVASSSAFLLPSSPPPNGSSIDSDWSIKNKKQPGFLRLISAWYAMVSLHFSHSENAHDDGFQQSRCQAQVLVFPSARGARRAQSGIRETTWLLASKAYTDLWR